MELNNLKDLLVSLLKELYSTEVQLLQALPKLTRTASSLQLKKLFEDHLTDTEMQVQRLETISKHFKIGVSGKKCRAIDALISEGKEIVESQGSSRTIEAALIILTQKILHYEISVYGSSRAIAESLGLLDIADLLQTSLDEESNADQRLTEIAEAEILSGELALRSFSNEDNLTEFSAAKEEISVRKESLGDNS